MEDEIPFEVPEGWAWCRLGEIATSNIGVLYHPEDIVEKGGTPILRSNNIRNEKLNFDEIVRVNVRIAENEYLSRGDLLICARNGSKKLVGKCTLIPELKEKSAFGAFMAVIRSKYNPYIISFLQSQHFKNYMESSNSTQIYQLTQNMINRAFIPLPPCSEQKAIVAKIEELFAQIDILENNKTDLQTAIKHAKTKILDLAIHGKLVPQDPNDEPASKLLEKIRSDSKNATDNRRYQNIDDSEFEIPENWCFTCITEVLNIYTGNSINSVEKEQKYTKVEGMNYIATKDIEFTGKINYRNGINIPDSYISKFKIAPQNSTLLCIEGGSAGRKIGFLNQEVCFVNKLCCFYSKYNFIENKYIYYFLQTPFFKSVFTNTKTGLIGGVSIETLKKFILPLPPLAEQKRIVAKIESLFFMLDKISENLS